MSMTHQALATITDKSLDDTAKENATKIAAVNILKDSFFLVFKISITFGFTVSPLLLADFTGMASFSKTSEFAMRLDVLLITTIAATAAVFLWRKISTKG